MKYKLLNWLTMVSMKGRGFEKRNAAGKNVPRLITFFHLHCILGKFTIAEKETDRLANLQATQWLLLEIFVQKVFETNLNCKYRQVKNLKKHNTLHLFKAKS